MARQMGEAVHASFAVRGAGRRPAADQVQPGAAQLRDRLHLARPRLDRLAPHPSTADEVQDAWQGLQQPLLRALLLRLLQSQAPALPPPPCILWKPANKLRRQPNHVTLWELGQV